MTTGTQTLTLRVHVPPKVVIDTEKLASLTSPELVYALLRTGEIVAGQRRNRSGGNKKRAQPEGVTDAQVAAAQRELAQASAGLDNLIQGVK
jgi:hypothetical protein